MTKAYVRLNFNVYPPNIKIGFAILRVSLLFESHLNAECHGNAVNQLRIYEQSMQYSLKHLVINWVQGVLVLSK